MKTLILLRHAHRDLSDRSLDNGLSEKGRKQAEAIVKLFAKELAKPPADIQLLSSPKKRCRETLEPLAAKLGAKVKVDPLLDEQEIDESLSDLSSRIARFAERLRESSASCFVACSHGDWLPAFLNRELGREIEMKKGAWVMLRYAATSGEDDDEGERPELVKAVQEP